LGTFAKNENVFMKKEELNQATEEAPVKSGRDTFRERFGQRFPDVNAEDEEAYYGALNGEFDRMEASDKAQRELGEVLARDPRSSGFLMVLKNGGNPMEYLIEQYGDDFRDALNDEEKAKEFAAAFAKNMEKRAESDKLRAQAEANMQTMIDALDAAQQDGSFSDDDAAKAFEYLYADGGMLDRILVNDIKKEDWMLLMKAAKYDDMLKEKDMEVADARAEGEVSGRNANIDIQKRKQSQVKAMPSNVPSNGSVRPAKKKDEFLAMLDEKTKSVWD
jgi:hypothetical protein